MKKLFLKTMAVISGFIAFISAKTVQAMMAYAPPEVFEKQIRKTSILKFVEDYTVLVMVFCGFVLVGLFSLIKMIISSFKKTKKKQ